MSRVFGRIYGVVAVALMLSACSGDDAAFDTGGGASDAADAESSSVDSASSESTPESGAGGSSMAGDGPVGTSDGGEASALIDAGAPADGPYADAMSTEGSSEATADAGADVSPIEGGPSDSPSDAGDVSLTDAADVFDGGQGAPDVSADQSTSDAPPDEPLSDAGAAPDMAAADQTTADASSSDESSSDGGIDDASIDATGASDADPDAADGSSADDSANADGGPDDGATDAADDGGAAVVNNIAFVTSKNYTAAQIQSLSHADDECNALAAAGGLAGTYRAWLSTSTVNAADRIRQTGARGWRRPGGRAIGDTLDDLLAGTMYYTVLVTDRSSGKSASFTQVHTGTARDGTSETTLGQCSDWTSTTGTVYAGAINGTTDVWSQFVAVPCSKALPIYCFGVDYNAPLVRTPSVGLRIAFITKSLFAPKQGGSIADGDDLCKTEAQAAGLTGTFKAYLGLSNAPPASRFVLDNTDWMRTDGVLVTPDFTIRLRAPVNVTADGKSYVGDVGVFTGVASAADAGVDAATTTCSDWSSTTSTASGGRAPFTDSTFQEGRTLDCSVGHRIYCFQE